jgi:hypothetical protein
VFLNTDPKFLTAATVVLSSAFVFASYMLGYNLEEMDYHICTGRSPTDNLDVLAKQVGISLVSILLISKSLRRNDHPVLMGKMSS